MISYLEKSEVNYFEKTSHAKKFLRKEAKVKMLTRKAIEEITEKRGYKIISWGNENIGVNFEVSKYSKNRSFTIFYCKFQKKDSLINWLANEFLN